MSANIKIGSHVENGVDFVKFQNADSLEEYVEFYNEEGNQDITNLNEFSVIGKETARISESERQKIIGGNIKKGVSILGVTGTYAIDPGSYQLKYPYTACNSTNSYGEYFTADTFGTPTTSGGYGGHTMLYLNIKNATIDLSQYGKLYYLTSNTTLPTEIPSGTALYIRKGKEYTMSSAPFAEGDSCVVQIGTYNIVNDASTLNFVAVNGGLCDGFYRGASTTSMMTPTIFAKIGTTYRRVYILSNEHHPYRLQLSETSVSSQSSSFTYDGTVYNYGLSSSNYSAVSISSLYWGDTLYSKKFAGYLQLAGEDKSNQYVYAYFGDQNYPILKFI